MPDIDALVGRVEAFVRDVTVPRESDSRWQAHGPNAELVDELRGLARAAGLIAPQLGDLESGSRLSHLETAQVFCAAGYSPLGPVALNVAAPDEGNMLLLDKIASREQRERYLRPLVAGLDRSAFLMTEPASWGGAGSDPSMLKTVAEPVGRGWSISGRKAFITGAEGAKFGIVMAKTGDSATLFMIDMHAPGLKIERLINTIDSSAPGGHALIQLVDVEVGAADVLGEVNQGLRYAQLRLAPARLTHCMRWWGAARRAQDIATTYACTREAFGRKLIDHEGIGFMLADNEIALRQSRLMIDWCAGLLDAGHPCTTESSMAKVAVSEALFGVADRCVQVLGGLGVSGETVVERVFRELRAFRIYDGPTEVHRWALAKKLKRAWAVQSTPEHFGGVEPP